MRKGTIGLLLATALGGCENAPDWLRLGPKRDEMPVSMPTEAEAATQPAGPTTAPSAANVPAPTPPAPEPPLPPAPEAMAAGTATAAPTAAPAPKAFPAPPPATAPPAPPAGDGAVMAYVNNEPVYMATLTELLIAGYGTGVAQQLIANELVRQEAARQGVSLTEADVQAENDRTLEEMFGKIDGADQRERLLGQLLDRNRVSAEQWDLTMRRNALLGKIAGKRLVVTEDDLKEEFGRQYERKVEVQHIQTPTLADAQKVLRELASGEEFTKLVTQLSVGPSAKEGGMLAPFGVKDTGTPPAIRDAALAMRKIGEVSDPIQIGTAFHVIKLVRVLEPENVKFESVRGTVEAAVRERKLRALQQDILQILLRGARVQYVHPVLKAQAEKGT